jgi:hypothetical protein
MNRLAYLFLIVALFIPAQVFTQDVFTRTTVVQTELLEPNGFGNMVVGVDFDQDGKTEVYLINTNTIDDPAALKPRIYKFELDGGIWQQVWMTEAPLPKQNTWPAMTWGDMDKDGKPEIYWGPVNWLEAGSENPARVLVYEYPGDGSDNMGVDDGFGGFEPNAKYSIANLDNVNIRPIKFILNDTDEDGTDELMFCDRAGSSGGYFYGVMSASDIPDNGGGIESWTLEGSGLGDTTLAGDFYDFLDMGNELVLFRSNGNIHIVSNDNGNWKGEPALTGLMAAKGSYLGAIKYDINNNGNHDLIVGTWGTGGLVYLLTKDSGFVQEYQIADLSSLGGTRLNGSAVGDLDSDGNPDFVFGTRYVDATSGNALVLRLEFQGGDYTNPANYIASVLDSGAITQGQMDVIKIANIDSDSDDEVFYTMGYPRGSNVPNTMDVFVLDRFVTSVDKENDLVPEQFYLGQNYPNPFNPSTQIKFGITEAGNIDLRVYDILGSEVAVVVNNQYMTAGSYSVRFDASNLASGVYVYKLTAGANTVSRKMQLLK